MRHRSHYFATLLFCLSFGILNTGIINAAYAIQKNTSEEQQNIPGKISGKIVDIVTTSGYTYTEIDTGKEKVWAAGPATALEIGDMIAISTRMPMKNFHSKAMDRDFPTLYFVDSFITDKKAPANTATGSPHGQIIQKQAAKPIKGINKLENGNSIAEIHAKKNSFDGKTIRVRGQVTKFTPDVMGKNWVHIRDSSSPEDLTITTDSTVTLDDVVVIEGKLSLDKDFGYGYIYPLIVEQARITKD